MTRTCILFEKEGGYLVPYSPSENPPAPTFFTGGKIRGTVLISNNAMEEPMFDTVQLLLRGLPYYLVKLLL
jgi:hypothetical protein